MSLFFCIYITAATRQMNAVLFSTVITFIMPSNTCMKGREGNKRAVGRDGGQKEGREKGREDGSQERSQDEEGREGDVMTSSRRDAVIKRSHET